MTTIVTRAGKGAPLTNVEVDANFTNLNNDKIEKTGGAITANTSTPALTITQTGTGDALRVEDAASPDSTPFVIDANGNVSVGGSIIQAIGNHTATGGNLTVRSSDGVEGGQISLNNKTNTTVAYNFDVDGSDHGRLFTTQNNTNLLIGQLGGTGGSVSIHTGGLSRVHVASDGNVGIGAVPSAGQSFANNKDITGAATSVATISAGQVRSDVTSQARYFQSLAKTQATAFTCGEVIHYLADQGTFGAGSTVTTQTGFYASSAIVGATNNYGFLGSIPAGTGRWNFYAAGTADNYFAGNVGIGVAPGGYKLAVAQTAATHAVASIYNADTTATYNTDLLLNNANIAGNAILSRRTNGEFWLYTSAAHPIAFYANSAERMRIDSSGNVLLKSATGALGYGTGAGGTVTQATSKSTAVTLNKPTGQITMNNEALAAGASVIFQLTNSLLTTTDTLVISPAWGAVNIENYRVDVVGCGAGAAKLRVTNISAASLSEALILNFAVLKGATA